MSRGPATFRQADLTKAIKGARQAGFEVSSVSVDRDGKITVQVATATPAAPPTEDDKDDAEIQRWLSDYDARNSKPQGN
jgi:hypothetical protein